MWWRPSQNTMGAVTQHVLPSWEAQKWLPALFITHYTEEDRPCSARPDLSVFSFRVTVSVSRVFLHVPLLRGSGHAVSPESFCPLLH